jgi:hypothetical protein
MTNSNYPSRSAEFVPRTAQRQFITKTNKLTTDLPSAGGSFLPVGGTTSGLASSSVPATGGKEIETTTVAEGVSGAGSCLGVVRTDQPANHRRM